MQLCYCGRARPCRPPLDPNQAPNPNKAPAPNTSCFLSLLREGAATTGPLSNLSPSWQAWLLGLCPLGSSFSTEGLSGSSEGKAGPSTGSAGAASRSLYTDMHRTTSRWGHFNTVHKGTAPKLAELQLCTHSHDTPTLSQPAGTHAGSHIIDRHANVQYTSGHRCVMDHHMHMNWKGTHPVSRNHWSTQVCVCWTHTQTHALSHAKCHTGVQLNRPALPTGAQPQPTYTCRPCSEQELRMSRQHQTDKAPMERDI